jgi:SNF2 family DNA or RNA helicase
LSLATVTDSLGLPPAPSLFQGAEAAAALPADNSLLPFLRGPAILSGPPPDPDKIYCPEGCELYGYQEAGVQFLMEHPVALLGDEMGLGKSIQALVALRLLIHRGEVKRALILCPKTVVPDWSAKLRMWTPDIPVASMDGKKNSRSWAWQRSTAPVCLIAYETYREDLKTGLADPGLFDMVILDEIQRIKNPDSVTHQAVARIRAPWRWGLSGTPLENRTAELVGVFQYLEPGLLPDERAYPAERIPRVIAPYVLRRCKADVLHHLPPKENRVVWLEMGRLQRHAYDQANWQLSQESDLFKRINQLKQICNLDPATGASCKMDFLEAELRRLTGQGDKALVYSQYPTVTLKALMPRFEPFGAWLFDGSLSDFSRQLIMHCFQQKEAPRVLAISLKCGGVGITLTRANHVYHYDSWWNPQVAQQAEDRTHRIGQKKPVYVTTILTKDSIEERIFNLMNDKRELFRQVMDPLTETEQNEDEAVSRLITKQDLMRLFH